ncbi:MAG: amino acid ABC transporter permease [Geminicoccaceae bacterium]
MLAGSLVTLQIAVLSMVIGIAIAVLLAVMTGSKSRWLRGIAGTWIEVARNTPALFQIYIAYFGLGQIGIHLDSYLALLAGITFNNAGYLAETFRGGLRAVPQTQVRAARSLGFGPIAAFRLIVRRSLSRRLPPDDQPDGLGDPDDVARCRGRRQHGPHRRHAGAQRPHLPHVRTSPSRLCSTTSSPRSSRWVPG